MNNHLDVSEVPIEKWNKLLEIVERAKSIGVSEVKTNQGNKDINSFIEEIKLHLQVEELKSLDPNREKEALDKLINLYTKTGRGLEEMFAKMSGYHKEYEALELSGKIESIYDRNQSKWYYPKDVYIFENDGNSFQALLFVDAYLGSIESWLKVTPQEIRDRDDYKDWLNINKEILLKSFGEEKIL